MKKKNLVFICVAVVFDYAAISYVQAVPGLCVFVAKTLRSLCSLRLFFSVSP